MSIGHPILLIAAFARPGLPFGYGPQTALGWSSQAQLSRHSKNSWFLAKCQMRDDKKRSWNTQARCTSAEPEISRSQSESDDSAKTPNSLSWLGNCAVKLFIFISVMSRMTGWQVHAGHSTKQPPRLSRDPVAAILQYDWEYTLSIPNDSFCQSSFESCTMQSESIQRYWMPKKRVVSRLYKYLASSQGQHRTRMLPCSLV